MVSPRLGYIIGKYRDPLVFRIVQNIRAAEAVAIDLIRAGVPVICAHTMTALMDGAAPDSHFLAADLVILKRCDFVVLLPGWEGGRGTHAEVALAKELGLPIFLWPYSRTKILVYAATGELIPDE